MPSRAETRFANFGRPTLNREHGVSVTLSDGRKSTAAFVARRGERRYEVYFESIDLIAGVTRRIYVLPAASCVIDSITVEPRKGFRITEGDLVFEIQPPDDKTKAVQALPGAYEWLCHAVQIK